MTKALKRWLESTKSLSVGIFFSSLSKLQLPCIALTEEVNVAKVRNKIILDVSTDTFINNFVAMVDGGRKANSVE